jgi:hypothetical protein
MVARLPKENEARRLSAVAPTGACRLLFVQPPCTSSKPGLIRGLPYQRPVLSRCGAGVLPIERPTGWDFRRLGMRAGPAGQAQSEGGAPGPAPSPVRRWGPDHPPDARHEPASRGLPAENGRVFRDRVVGRGRFVLGSGARRRSDGATKCPPSGWVAAWSQVHERDCELSHGQAP